MRDKNLNLSEEYYKIVKDNPYTKMTWDEFFDMVNLPKKLRLDFGCACILRGFNKIYKENNDIF